MRCDIGRVSGRKYRLSDRQCFSIVDEKENENRPSLLTLLSQGFPTSILPACNFTS